MSGLDGLSALEREVVALRYGLEGRPRLGLAAVARHCGIAVEEVRLLELTALKRLATRLSQALEPPAPRSA
jgi:DNA-directed RNA polymerase sigma subunit (sigma70/sigma32)